MSAAQHVAEAATRAEGEAAAEVVVFPAEVLAQPSLPVLEFDAALRVLCVSMMEARKAQRGLGLAACQIGVPARVFVILTANDSVACLVNPEVEWSSEETADESEGCLSLPGAFVQVRRSLALRLRAFSAEGEETTLELEGLQARIVQHEMDHLNGRLVIDRVTRQQRRQALRRFEAARP